jgi:ABC-type uncharacterized transport system ATPase component
VPDAPENGTGFSTKEMLVRMDGKLDVMAGKQTHYDVEQALLKARVEVQERTLREHTIEEQKTAEAVRANLEAAERLMDRKVDELSSGQQALALKLAYYAGGLAMLMLTLEAISRVWLK